MLIQYDSFTTFKLTTKKYFIPRDPFHQKQKPNCSRKPAFHLYSNRITDKKDSDFSLFLHRTSSETHRKKKTIFRIQLHYFPSECFAVNANAKTKYSHRTYSTIASI